MKWIIEHGQLVGVELTRRNLETLIAKLDRNVEADEQSLERSEDPFTRIEHSQCTISKPVLYEAPRSSSPWVFPVVPDEVYVRSVENEAHYEAEGRPAGRMHECEEPLISRPKTGVL